MTNYDFDIQSNLRGKNPVLLIKLLHNYINQCSSPPMTKVKVTNRCKIEVEPWRKSKTQLPEIWIIVGWKFYCLTNSNTLSIYANWCTVLTSDEKSWHNLSNLWSFFHQKYNFFSLLLSIYGHFCPCSFRAQSNILYLLSKVRGVWGLLKKWIFS